MRRNRLLTLAGAAAGVVAATVAERAALHRKRALDPEAGEEFGTRRGWRSRFIDLPDGARLFVEEVGPPDARRAAVFVHGSVLRTDIWHYQLPGLGGHRLIFYDKRGHGLSQPKGSAPYTVSTLAGDLHAVMEEADVDEAVVVGHSVGGMTAMELCKQRGDLLGRLLKGIVLVNTTHRPAVETIFGGAAVARFERITRRPFDTLGSHAHRIDSLRKVIRPSDLLFWGVAVAAFGPRASASQIDFVYDMLAETPTDTILELIRSLRDFDVEDAIGEVTVPVLVIGGTHDRLTVPAASRYLAERLPKAELELLPGCGHMSMLERHREFNTMVERFLGDWI